MINDIKSFPIENFESHLPSQMDFCGGAVRCKPQKPKYCKADSTICRAEKQNRVYRAAGAYCERKNSARQIVLYAGQKNRIAFISVSKAFQR